MTLAYLQKQIALCIYLGVFTCCELLAQCATEPLSPLLPTQGYIVLTNGDTLVGKIKAGKIVENNISNITFTDKKGEKKNYPAKELKGMGAQLMISTDEEDIRIRRISADFETQLSMKKGVPVFMQRLADGKIKILKNEKSISNSSSTSTEVTTINGLFFKYSIEDGLHFTYNTRVTSSIRCWNSSYYVSKQGGELKKIDKSNYESIWEELFGDCDKIQQELALNPSLKKFSNFLLLVKIYNEICE